MDIEFKSPMSILEQEKNLGSRKELKKLPITGHCLVSFA